MSNREKFEAWYLENWGHTEDEHETLFERDPDSDEEYYRLGVRMSHQAWQAATNSMRDKCAALAAENAGLNAFVDAMLSIAWQGGSADGADIEQLALKHGLIRQEVYIQDDHENLVDDPGNFEDGDPVYFRVETPATDSFLAEVLAQARSEGINYAAGRLAAAFNHGYVDKPLAEVCDVVRMIMDTKEELANSTPAAADGLSGEYAENFLAEFAAQLRQGGAA